MADVKDSTRNVSFADVKSSPDEKKIAIEILDKVIAEYEEELD